MQTKWQKRVQRAAYKTFSCVYVSSTGVIGTPMPMDRIRPKIPELVSSLGKLFFRRCCAAIMTTDTFPKIVKKRVKIGDQTGTIAGICKGAGMICPNMATMLCFIMTDIAVNKRRWIRTLLKRVKKSFNRLTIDGDMSTNDTVLDYGQRHSRKSSDYRKIRKHICHLRRLLMEVDYELSKMIAKDGEGATKFIEIEVKGAKNDMDAEKAAFAVANSNLVKTADLRK